MCTFGIGGTGLAIGGVGEAIPARIGGDTLLQDSEVEQKDANARLGQWREQLLGLLVIGIRPGVALRGGEVHIVNAVGRLGEPFRAAGAQPGDVAGARCRQVLHAVGGSLRRPGRARNDVSGLIGMAREVDARQIVAADGERDEVAIGEARSAGGELLEFVGEAVAIGEVRHGVGIVGSRTADGIIRQAGQAVDRLQRVDEVRAAGEPATV